jgi:hypothetical protein
MASDVSSLICLTLITAQSECNLELAIPERIRIIDKDSIHKAIKVGNKVSTVQNKLMAVL